MTLLNDVKTSLRISQSATAFDSEVSDLIAAAKDDLRLAGVLESKVDAADESLDSLVKRAVTVYCKANFGYENPEAERFMQSYNSLKAHLTLSQEFTVEATS